MVSGRIRMAVIRPNGYPPVTLIVVLAVILLVSACTAPFFEDAARDGTPVGTAHLQLRAFAASSAWNTTIPEDPVLDPDSEAMAPALGQGRRGYALLYQNGVPVYEAYQSTPRYHIACTEDWGPCPLEAQQIPIPPGAEPNSGSDGAMVVIDRSANRVYDFWRLRTTAGGWASSWGGSTALDGNGSGGATGAGVSVLAGLVRTFEIRAGRIDHALSFSSSLSCRGTFRPPAIKTDGTAPVGPCVPEGARIQLDPSVDVDAIPGITPGEKAVAQALQTYGAFLRDNANVQMAFSFEKPTGEADPYPVAAGFSWDYYEMPHIPWDRLRVLRQWNGR
jgi:hypothetical protein